MAKTNDTYTLKAEFLERFDCGWSKLKDWRLETGKDSPFSERTFMKFYNKGVSVQNLRRYLDYLADFVADKFNTRLTYRDMVNGPEVGWFEHLAGSPEFKNRKNLRRFVSQADREPIQEPMDSAPVTTAEGTSAQQNDSQPVPDQEGAGKGPVPVSQNASQTVQVELTNENNVDITVQVLTPPPLPSGSSDSLPQPLLPSKPETPGLDWRVVVLAASASILVIAVIVVAMMMLWRTNDSPPLVSRLKGMVYVENMPVQEGSVRLLGTGRSDNIRILDRSNPGYFEFPDTTNEETVLEFRIDVDQPLDMSPTIVRVPIGDDSQLRIDLEIQPKSVIFPRKRARQLERVNEDIPMLNRMAVLAYLGMDDEANRLAEKIQSRIVEMDSDEKYQYFSRRGFCHWQANEFKQAATYYSQAMDLRTDNYRHVILASESVRLSAAGTHYLGDLETAVDWVDSCRETEGQLGKSDSTPIHLLNATGARLAIAMGNLEHGKKLLLMTYPKMKDSQDIDLETLFSTCIDLVDVLVLAGEFPKAQTYAKEAKSLASRFPADSKRKLWAEKMADGFEALLLIEYGQLDSVESKLTAAIEFVFQQYPENLDLAYLFLSARARVYESQRKGELAIKDIKRCIEWSEGQKELSFVNERYLAIWRNRYARILIQHVEGSLGAAKGYSEALQNVEKSLAWAELQSPRDERMLNMYRATKSNILYMQNKLKEAYKLINLAIDWGNSQKGAESLVHDWLAQRAAVLSYLARESDPVDLKMLEQADQDYSACILANEQSKDDDREMGVLLSARARIRQLLAQEDVEKRSSYLDAALLDADLAIGRFKSFFGDQQGNVYVYMGLKATILADLERKDEAKKLIAEAFQLFEESGSKSLGERLTLKRFESLVNAAK